jgi:hypothetical protein
MTVTRKTTPIPALRGQPEAKRRGGSLLFPVLELRLHEPRQINCFSSGEGGGTAASALRSELPSRKALTAHEDVVVLRWSDESGRRSSGYFFALRKSSILSAEMRPRFDTS